MSLFLIHKLLELAFTSVSGACCSASTLEHMMNSTHTQITNRNFRTLEDAMAAQSRLLCALVSGRRGKPLDLFGQPVERGLTASFVVSVRKFTGTGWEMLVESTCMLNFDNAEHLARAQKTLQAQIDEVLPESTQEIIFVVRLAVA